MAERKFPVHTTKQMDQVDTQSFQKTVPAPDLERGKRVETDLRIYREWALKKDRKPDYFE